MSNHGFVTTYRKILTPDRVDADVREIVERRFRGQLDIACEKLRNPPRKGTYGMWAWWELHPKGLLDTAREGLHYDFEISLRSPYKLEFRHPHSDWGFWAQSCVFEEEFSFRYHGVVTDEGIADRWIATQERLLKYATYRMWTESRMKAIGRPRGQVPVNYDWKLLSPVLQRLDREIARTDPKVLFRTPLLGKG